jgi:hypothetical protein
METNRSVGRKHSLAMASILMVIATTTASGSDDCERFHGGLDDMKPSVWSTTLLSIRKGPGRNHPVIEKLPLGHPGMVEQKCGDWVEINTDRFVGKQIKYIKGWIYLPLTCTTSDWIRGIEWTRRNTPKIVRRIIAPECSVKVNTRADYLSSHSYEN